MPQNVFCVCKLWLFRRNLAVFLFNAEIYAQNLGCITKKCVVKGFV